MKTNSYLLWCVPVKRRYTDLAAGAGLGTGETDPARAGDVPLSGGILDEFGGMGFEGGDEVGGVVILAGGIDAEVEGVFGEEDEGVEIDPGPGFFRVIGKGDGEVVAPASFRGIRRRSWGWGPRPGRVAGR
jgi:hypothetical protein